MIKELYPKAYRCYLTLPLLGPILEDFDNWLLEKGYRRSSRQPYIHHTVTIDRYFRKHGRYRLSELTHSDLQACRKWYRRRKVHAAGAARLLEKFLDSKGLLPPVPISPTSFSPYLEAYRSHLEDIRGFASKTVCGHLYIASRFLDYLTHKQSPLKLAELSLSDIEAFIITASEKHGRASLQHVVAQLRSYLRFLATSGEVSPGLDAQIDTPRLYRQEQLPRTLPWETVCAFLNAIDRQTPRGLRDYTIFFLMATYGLRNCDIVALTLDDIHWGASEIQIVQHKTGYPLTLPLTDAVGSVLVHYLRNSRPRSPHRQLFLRTKAPIAPLGRTAVTDAFRARVRRSGLAIPFRGSHCLRHSYAVHLLRQGASVKTIGDLLGHRTAESTYVYLRLAVEDLREVALPVPQVCALQDPQETQP